MQRAMVGIKPFSQTITYLNSFHLFSRLTGTLFTKFVREMGIQLLPRGKTQTQQRKEKLLCQSVNIDFTLKA